MPKRRSGLSLPKVSTASRVSQPWKRHGDVDPTCRLENCRQHSLGQRINIVRCDERRFNVDLRKLRLAIGSQIFIAKRFRDLKIFFHSGDHEELLVLLWCLWQGVKFSRQQSAGNEKVTRPFRCAFAQNRRLDFKKSLRIQILASGLSDPVPDLQIAR